MKCKINTHYLEHNVNSNKANLQDVRFKYIFII